MLSAALRQNKAFLAVFAAALFLRVFRLDLPFVEPYNSLSRQAIVATVARNFYQHGFNFFYPEIDENGPGPYLYNAEMPVYSYLMAIAYRLAGGVREWAARLVSVLFSLGTVAILYLWIRRTDGARAAAAAAAFAALSPLNLAISRSVQPDATMLFASVGALYFLFVYSEEGKRWQLAASAVLMALSLGTRIQMLPCLAVPAFYLAWRRDGARLWVKPRYWLYALGVSSVFLWYFAMWKAGRESALIYSPYDYLKNRGPEGLPFWASYAPVYWAQIARVLLLHVLTPLGAVLAALGLLPRRGSRWLHPFWKAWLFGYLLYAVIFWRFLIDHSYYQIPCVPIAAYLIGRGAERGWEIVRKSAPAAVLAFVLAAASAANAAYLYRGLYDIPPSLSAVVRAGKRVQELTPKDSLILAFHGTSTIQLYYCNRKGWAFDLEGDPKRLIEKLEEYRSRGAAYFVTAMPDTLGRNRELSEYLAARYPVLERSSESVIYDLR